MGFLDDLKNLHNLKQKATEMQAALAEQNVTGLSQNQAIAITMNGNQEVLSVNIDEKITAKSEIETGIKEAFADARTKIEEILRNKMSLLG